MKLLDGVQKLPLHIEKGGGVLPRVLIVSATKGKYYLKVVCVSREIGSWFCGFLLQNKE